MREVYRSDRSINFDTLGIHAMRFSVDSGRSGDGV